MPWCSQPAVTTEGCNRSTTTYIIYSFCIPFGIILLTTVFRYHWNDLFMNPRVGVIQLRNNTEVQILNLEFLVWLCDLYGKRNLYFVCWLGFLTLLTYDNIPKCLLITQMYVKDFKIFTARHAWSSRSLHSSSKLSPAPGIGLVSNCWRYFVHGKLFSAIE